MRDFTAAWIMGLVSLIVIFVLVGSMVAIINLTEDNYTIPSCTEDEVISYRDFPDNNTLFCLHIDKVKGEF